MVYLDDANINCEIPQDTDDYQSQCNCTSDWLKKYPNSCTAGDVEHARGRYLMGLRNNEYNQFLDYMCPAAREQGLFPPPGTDPTVCTRPILGTYDDHDYGWNNGNERLPNKDEFKTMYLDAIGESPTSPRRNHDRGLWWKYTLNANNPHKMIDVFLLDERYEREPVACYTYRDYCERYALLQPGAT
jgi:alkaline phosphatase D